MIVNDFMLIKSRIPGRIRFKIILLSKNDILANRLEYHILSLSGIKKVKLNIYTNSCLIYYKIAEISFEQIVSEISQLLGQSLQREDTKKKIASTSEAALNSAHTKALIKDDWYLMNLAEIKLLLNSRDNHGLNSDYAAEVLNHTGLNQLKEKDQKSIFKLFLEQFDDFLIKVLIGASAISFFMGQVADALTIVIIVLVEGLLGVWQNYKAEKAITALKDYSATETKVLRDGEISKVKSQYLVPGDLIFLETGDVVPADARLMTATDFKVNETILTGESEPVTKSAGIRYPRVVPLTERKNMIYLGTTVVRGNCQALIVQTGMQTEMGKIAEMIGDTPGELTPLQQDLYQMGKYITWACLGISLGITLSGLIGGNPFLQMLRTGVSLAIGAIPEGLTTILTISLAFGVQRMVKKNAIVKKLPAVETLSSVDVICTDKTGTLTKGEMTVKQIYTLSGEYNISGHCFSKVGSIKKQGKMIDPLNYYDLNQLLTVAVLCNNAKYKMKKNAQYEIIGDPTEGALLILARKARLKVEEFTCYTREKEIAFESQNKKMSVICKDNQDRYSIHLKGAPQVVLDHCTQIIDGDKIRKITEEDINLINKQVGKMARNALRVMGFAYREFGDYFPEKEDEAESELTFAGLTGIIDPPRTEIKSSLEKCQQAGVRTIMITGDHKDTAIAVGRSIGLLQPDDEIVTGEELEQLSELALQEQINKVKIFARTTPAQKLRIIKALKAEGHIVAMTGDGVNDAPAMKAADIGIAMGKNGSEVTRQAGDIILADDNYATIVAAIEEGRGISGNIKKFIRYVLSGNTAEVLVIFFSAMIGLPIPLIPAQILMINLVTEGIPALALGVEPADPDNMLRPPRPAERSIFDDSLTNSIISRGMMMGISTLGIYSGYFLFTGNLIKAQTLAYANLVTGQMFHVFDCRNTALKDNIYIIPAVTISSLLLLSTIYLPAFNGLFQTVPLALFDWLAIISMSSVIGRLDFFRGKVSNLLPLGKKEIITVNNENKQAELL